MIGLEYIKTLPVAPQKPKPVQETVFKYSFDKYDLYSLYFLLQVRISAVFIAGERTCIMVLFMQHIGNHAHIFNKMDILCFGK